MNRALRCAGVIGLANLLWLYASFWVGLHTRGILWFQVVPVGWLVISILGYRWAMRAVLEGTPPTIRNGMHAGIVIAGVTAVIAALAQVGYYTVVHPEWTEVMVEQTRAHFAERGASPDELARRVAAARDTFRLGPYAAASAGAALALGLLLAPFFTWRERRRRYDPLR